MKGISLKPTTISDYEDYYNIRCSPGDIYWNGYKTKPDKDSFYSLFRSRLGDVSLEKPEDRRIYLVKLRDENSNISIGFVQLIKRRDGIDIGYTIIEKYQNHGYATQALKLGMEQALHIENRIYVQIRDDNIASQKVAIKCGFIPTDEVTIYDYPIAGKVKLRKYRLEEST